MADGDPASDVLITQAYFLPADANASARQQGDLSQLLVAARHAGLPIRVAVIPSSYDLGSVMSVWREPQRYADFLAYELSNSYRGALLVVMPNGFGLHWPGHATAGAARDLAAIQIMPGAAGLLRATDDAVEALAAADGITLRALTDQAKAGAAGIPSTAIAIVAAFAVLLLAGVLVERRRLRRQSAATRPQAAGLSERPRAPWAPGDIRTRLLILEGALLALALGVGVALVVARLNNGAADVAGSAAVPSPPFTFPAGHQPAPAFQLRDENGKAVSLSAYRGRPVIVTFIDPLCRNLCPLAAHVLNAVDRELPPGRRVPIIAVSVDIYADTRADMLEDVRRWSLVPQWRWAVGSAAQLAAVWKAYEVGVSITTRRAAGVTEHIVEHEEIAYVIDPNGYERALFTWPYSALGVEQTIAHVAGL
jgi:cytochrome oxidase Cu insertion factor (SCO1/SenC/PrrC family)